MSDRQTAHRRYLVVGSSGHLGEALMRTLPSRMSNNGDGKRDIVVEVVGVDCRPSAFTTHTLDISSDDIEKEVFKKYENFDGIFHTAALQKPHIDTHSEQEFIQTNVLGTQRLLDLARKYKIPNFIFTSTTSTFGKVIERDDNEDESPSQEEKLPKKSLGKRCIWLNEEVQAIPRNIYGITKVSAEQLCFLAAEKSRSRRRDGRSPGEDGISPCPSLNCVVLRASRFFLEGDDDAVVKNTISDCNLKVNELLYRRIDISDLVNGHILAMKQAGQFNGETFVLSSPPLFSPRGVSSLGEPNEGETNNLLIIDKLNTALAQYARRQDSQLLSLLSSSLVDDDGGRQVLEDPPSVTQIYEELNWKLPTWFDRLYDSSKAVRLLGWKPEHSFTAKVFDSLLIARRKKEEQKKKGERVEEDLVDYLEISSDLHRTIGKRSYQEDGSVYVA